MRLYKAVASITALTGPEHKVEAAVADVLAAVTGAREDERRIVSRRLRLGAEEAKRNGDTQIAETLFNYSVSVAACDHLDSAEETT